MDGAIRANIKHGAKVAIVQKHDQRSGRLTEGVVRDILTKSAQSRSVAPHSRAWTPTVIALFFVDTDQSMATGTDHRPRGLTLKNVHKMKRLPF